MRRRALLSILLLSFAAQPSLAQDDASGSAKLFRWTDLRGVPHLTNEPPQEYEVSREEWIRLRAEYPGEIEDSEPEKGTIFAELPPGARAEQALADWWNIAGPRGAFRGRAVVTPDEKIEMDRLVAIARDAMKEARGTDLSPAAGRAAAELRRAQGVEVIVKDAAERAGVPLERVYPLSLSGKLVFGPASTRYEVRGRISNRSTRDAGLFVSLYLHVDGRMVAAREVSVPKILARGEAPIATTFELPAAYLGIDESRLTVRARVEHSPEPSSVGG